MTPPTDVNGPNKTLQDFKQRASSCLKGDNTEAQELLAKMTEISDDLERMKGGWSAAIGFRAWNEFPATARDPRPSAIESFRQYKQLQGGLRHEPRRITGASEPEASQ